jgi:hypothetical protein
MASYVWCESGLSPDDLLLLILLVAMDAISSERVDDADDILARICEFGGWISLQPLMETACER